MGYITKNYLKTQFNNFADRIASIFARKTDVPTKTSQLQNDSGFKTTDSNTTYALSKSGSTITLTGSDGSKSSVTDSDTNTTYGNMKAATASAAGKAGLVPAPAAGAQSKFLRGDGTWQPAPAAVTPTNNLLATTPGKPLDAVQGKVLNDKIEDVNSSLKGFEPILDETGKITGYKTQAGADTVFPFSDGVDFQKASIIKQATNTSNSLGNLSMTLKTTTKHTIITSVKGGNGMSSIANDSIICSDNEAIINNMVYNPKLNGFNSQSHHFVWLVEAKIGSTIEVIIPKNEYASTIETYAIAI